MAVIVPLAVLELFHHIYWEVVSLPLCFSDQFLLQSVSLCQTGAAITVRRAAVQFYWQGGGGLRRFRPLHLQQCSCM